MYDHTAILPVEYVEAFERFIESDVPGGKLGARASLLQRLDEILVELDDVRHYALEVNMLSLLEFNQQLASILMQKPNHIMPLFAEAIQSVARRRLAQSEDRMMMSPKKYIHPRLVRPPLCESVCKPNVSSIRSSDVGLIIQVRGTVIRTGQIKMLESEREYSCDKCAHRFKVLADMDQHNGSLVPPVSCPAQRAKPCKSVKFSVVEGSRVCRDYQEVKIQEQLSLLTVGSIPRSMLVVLEDDLVDRCKPGDDVVVVGVVSRRWKKLLPDVRPDIDMVLVANHLKVSNEDKVSCLFSEEQTRVFEAYWQTHREQPLRARDHILRSFCPQLCGLYKVKLALMLALIGGCSHTDASGSQTRGESHCLMIGDPGLGKSQLLKYCAKISQRAVLTTGIGTTSAGLTVTAQRDNGGEWVLEAGALVLADGGVCCIDEFDCIRSQDRVSLHEAMEQQTISVAKAGLVCKLNTRCTVIAATNPKGKFDADESASVNTSLPAPLLSRFDLVLLLLDNQSQDWDRRLSSHVLLGGDDANLPMPPPTSFPAGGHRLEHEGHAAAWQGSRCVGDGGSQSGEALGALWDVDKIRMYIAWVKKTIQPQLTDESEKVLVDFFRHHRSASARNAARTTVRMLQGLVRLAQAHARLMLRHQVTEQDAIIAVSLVDSTVMNCSDSALDVSTRMMLDFPIDAEQAYSADADRVWRKLRDITWDDDSLTGLGRDCGAGAGDSTTCRCGASAGGGLRCLCGEGAEQLGTQGAEMSWGGDENVWQNAQRRSSAYGHGGSHVPGWQGSGQGSGQGSCQAGWGVGGRDKPCAFASAVDLGGGRRGASFFDDGM